MSSQPNPASNPTVGSSSVATASLTSSRWRTSQASAGGQHAAAYTSASQSGFGTTPFTLERFNLYDERGKLRPSTTLRRFIHAARNKFRTTKTALFVSLMVAAVMISMVVMILVSLMNYWYDRENYLYLSWKIRNLDDSVINDPTVKGASYHFNQATSAKLSSSTSNSYDELTLIVLCHREFHSLLAAAETWQANGLLDYVDSLLIFMNEGSKFSAEMSLLPDYLKKKAKIILNSQNSPIGAALSWAVAASQTELVLFLEKDFQLIENKTVLASRLDMGKRILLANVADTVRYRHRAHGGHPNYAHMMFQGREEKIISQQRNQLCYAHHWLKHFDQVFPEQVQLCDLSLAASVRLNQHPRPSKNGSHQEGQANAAWEDPEDIYCIFSEFCGYSNNPMMFRRSWFLKSVAKSFQPFWGAGWPLSDIESWANTARSEWPEKRVRFALGGGLFTHVELNEQRNDEVWYVWRRVFVQVEEFKVAFEIFLRKNLKLIPMAPDQQSQADPQDASASTELQAYTFGSLPKSSGIRSVKDQIPEWIFSLANMSFSGDVEYQAMVWKDKMTSLLDEGIARYCDILGSLIGSHFIPIILVVPPLDPLDMNITFVTAFYPHVEAKHNSDHASEKNLESFVSNWMQNKYFKVVFSDQNTIEALKSKLTATLLEQTKFIGLEKEEFRKQYAFSDLVPMMETNYEDAEMIREWMSLDALFLRNIKVHLLAKAANQNPFGTTHFVFSDWNYSCMQSHPLLSSSKSVAFSPIDPGSDFLLRNHMMYRFFGINRKVRISSHASHIMGVPTHIFLEEMRLLDRQSTSHVNMFRGSLFGGDRMFSNMVSLMYELSLFRMLRAGAVSLDEHVLTLMHRGMSTHSHTQLFHAFSETKACPSSMPISDRSCMAHRKHSTCTFFNFLREILLAHAEEQS